VRGSIGVETRLKSIFFNTPLYNRRIMKKLISARNFSQSKQAQFRLKVIDFFKKHGVSATIDAFCVSRRTIFRWKKILKESGGRLDSLIPKSKKPIKTRRSIIDGRIITFIKTLREQYNRIGKEKIKPLLDNYCQKNNLKPVSISTIGRIIKRYNLYFARNERVYHNLKGKYIKKKLCYKKKIRYSPKVRKPGYIEIDTVVKFVSGIKLYILNAIDINLKFQFSYGYTRLNSLNALDFLKKLELVYPIKDGIKTVQTDNGLEFLGKFDSYLEKRKINHLFIYPRCPRINAYIERANRSLNEEFLEEHQYLVLDSLLRFNQKLMDYLIWYNLPAMLHIALQAGTQRVHKSLNNQTPIDYLVKNYSKSAKCGGLIQLLEI
jgi:transposase InsO family protein